MRILIGCEVSGKCRDAFRARGHDAVSCDILPTKRQGPHLQCDVMEVLGMGWDAAIFFPDCTYLTVSGLHWNKRVEGREQKTVEAIAFVEKLWNCGIPKIAIENPVGCLSTRSTLGKPTQIIQPYNFGEDASKATCLWLKSFPKLIDTGYYPPRITQDGKKRWGNQTDSGQNKLPPSDDRAAIRAESYDGIMQAMGQQWG